MSLQENNYTSNHFQVNKDMRRGGGGEETRQEDKENRPGKRLQEGKLMYRGICKRVTD